MGRADIIDNNIRILEIALKTYGILEPDPGGAFGSASNLLNAIDDLLGFANPDSRWFGEGSYAYEVMRYAQQKRTEALAGIDRVIEDIVSTQADLVRKIRKHTENSIEALKVARHVAVALSYIPFVGGAISKAFQWAFCGVLMVVYGILTADFIAKTIKNALKITQLIQEIINLLLSLPELIWDFLKDFPWPSLDDLFPWLPDFDWPSLDDLWPPNWDKLFPWLPDFKFPEFSWPPLPGLPDWVPWPPTLSNLFPGLGDFNFLQNIPVIGGMFGNGLPTLSSIQQTIGQVTGSVSGGGLFNQLVSGAGQSGSQLVSQTASGGGGSGGGGAERTTLASAVKDDDEEKDDGLSLAAAGAGESERAPVGPATGPAETTQEPTQRRLV